MTNDKSCELVCPKCKGNLILKNNSCKCIYCNHDFENEEDILIFSKSELFYSVFTRNDAIEISNFAKTTSWNEAIAKFANKIGKYTYSYITDESRADWVIYLPILRNKKILDIGSGWGNIAIVLSKRCEEYFCCDGNVHNLKLLKSRLRDANINNVRLFMYNANSTLLLPFRDGCLDIVILNGVLEWMGNIDHDMSPRQLQIIALKEIRRVLKSDGLIYVGIENRFALGHLRGGRPHGELPYIGLLPRNISNLITKLFTGKRHGTYIYSISGYYKLLKEAGFTITDIFTPLPDYRFPKTVIPIKPRWIHKYWLTYLNSNHLVKFRIAKSLGIKHFPLHHMANSYSILAKKII